MNGNRKEAAGTSPAVKAASVFILLLVLGLVFLSFQYPYQFRENRQFLSRAESVMDFSFNDLSGKWTEADLRERFSYKTIICFDETTSFGDKSCSVDLTSHNGAPAMLVVFFFTHDRLRAAFMHVPWWHHGKMRESLERLYGKPTTTHVVADDDTSLTGWKLENQGGLFYNTNRAANPLMWSAMLWYSPDYCKETDCYKNLNR